MIENSPNIFFEYKEVWKEIINAFLNMKFDFFNKEINKFIIRGFLEECLDKRSIRRIYKGKN